MTSKQYYSNDEIKYIGDPHTCNNTSYNGIQYWKNGKIMYVGQWMNSQKNGTGTEYWPNGKLNYIGNWKSNKRCGHGVSYNRDGIKIYEGDFINDCSQGYGSEYRIDGTLLYEGFWNDDQYNGDGTIYHSDGTTKKYIGWFDNGKLNGDVIQYNKYGSMIFKGIMVNYKKNGFGILFSDNDMKIKYSGTFCNDKKHGLNVKDFDDNRKLIYQGSYNNGIREGTGISYGVQLNIHTNLKPYETDYLKKCYYKGMFNDNMFHGNGSIYSPDYKIIFHGTFVKNTILYGKWYSNISHRRCTCTIFNPIDNEECIYDENNFNNNICAIIHHKNKTVTLLNIDFQPFFRGEISKQNYYKYGELNTTINNKQFIKYKGEFKNNKPHGKGTQYDEYARLIFEGTYYNGEYYSGTLYKYKNDCHILDYQVQIKPSDLNKRKRSDDNHQINTKKIKLTDVPSQYICPISKKIMLNPVTYLNNKIYDRDSVINFLKSKPYLDTETINRCMFINNDLKDEIQKFIKDHELS